MKEREYRTTEILAEEAHALPEREALAWLNIANVTAVNLALAINAGSFGSTARAAAGQLISVRQR